jgi:AcrR family transcriptional regulator
MSLRDLATESGLSMGALYTYFDTKDTLLMMILGEVSSAVSEALGSPPEGFADNPAEHLHWLLETHIYLTEVMQPWFVFAYMEAKAFPKEGREKATKSELSTEKMIADTLADGVESGLFSVVDVEFTASHRSSTCRRLPSSSKLPFGVNLNPWPGNATGPIGGAKLLRRKLPDTME